MLSSGPPTLLTLPRELRDVIYGFVALVPEEETRKYSRMVPNLDEKPDCAVIVTVPDLALLRSCKQLHAEYKEIAFDNAHCSLLPTSHQTLFKRPQVKAIVPKSILEKCEKVIVNINMISLIQGPARDERMIEWKTATSSGLVQHAMNYWWTPSKEGATLIKTMLTNVRQIFKHEQTGVQFSITMKSHNDTLTDLEFLELLLQHPGIIHPRVYHDLMYSDAPFASTGKLELFFRAPIPLYSEIVQPGDDDAGSAEVVHTRTRIDGSTYMTKDSKERTTARLYPKGDEEQSGTLFDFNVEMGELEYSLLVT